MHKTLVFTDSASSVARLVAKRDQLAHDIFAQQIAREQLIGIGDRLWIGALGTIVLYEPAEAGKVNRTQAFAFIKQPIIIDVFK
jgi:hypothetical protein